MNDSNRYTALKARVEALGYELLVDNVEPDESTGHYQGHYIFDPKAARIIITQVPDDEIDEWCKRRERNAEPASPLRKYNRLLELLVIASPKDRFKAVDLRTSKGVDAAIAYLGECTITDEPYEEPTEVDQQDRLNDLLRAGESVCHLLSMDPDLDDVITTAASHASDLMEEARGIASALYGSNKQDAE